MVQVERIWEEWNSEGYGTTRLTLCTHCRELRDYCNEEAILSANTIL